MAKKVILFAAILLVLASTHDSHAQSTQPEVLNGAAIFTGDVKVIETLPTVSFDNTIAHAAYVLDTNGSRWRMYPYPNDLIEVKGALERSDGTWLLSSEGYYPFKIPQSSNTWVFDAKTGLFTHLESVCGTVKGLPGVTWLFYQADSQSPFRLCFTETGYLSQPLPQAIQSKVCNNYHSPSQLSPDKKWLLFSTCELHFSLYSYEIATDRFISLSLTPSQTEAEVVTVDQWADNTHAIVYSSLTTKDSPRDYSLVDVTRANSQQIIISGGSVDNIPIAAYYENPRHYEWYTEDENDPNLPCTFHRFDLETLKTTDVKLPGAEFCGGILLADGSGDRLAFSPNTSRKNQVVAAIRYNLMTGQSRTLFKDLIPWVQNISPGGSYADLFLGDLRIESFESFDYPHPYFFVGIEDLSRVNLAVFSLKTGQQVYKSPLSSSAEGTRYGNYEGALALLSPQLTWLQDDVFFLVGATYYQDSNTTVYKTRLIHLRGNNATEHLEIAGKVVAFDAHYLVLENPQIDGSTSLSIDDLQRDKVIPIISKLDLNRYDLAVQLRPDDSLGIIIYDWSRRNMTYPYSEFSLRHWVITVGSQ